MMKLLESILVVVLLVIVGVGYILPSVINE